MITNYYNFDLVHFNSNNTIVEKETRELSTTGYRPGYESRSETNEIHSALYNIQITGY